ncbi:type VI secretion system-associated FHA domain protein TagH, partial [Roseobacter sp.]
MTLCLKAHDPSHPDAAPIEVVMQGAALCVGRGAENDLVLPDPDRMLSKRHCVLERDGAGYTVRDLSTNGTFLNYQPGRLDGTPTRVNAGDVILVGPFELVVEIRAQTQPSPPPTAAQIGVLENIGDENTDFLDELLGGDEPPGADPFAVPPQGASAPDHSAPMQDHFDAPRAQAAVIPDNWDADLTAPVPGAPPPPAPKAAPTDAAALRAFMDGLGLGDAAFPEEDTAETMARLGRVMAAMITGLRDIMMTRAALKSEMRVNRTMIEAGANNPLKFSVSAVQAIEAMILPAQPGYLAPEAAAAEVLSDIKSHEVATMTGMQAALRALLAQLS